MRGAASGAGCEGGDSSEGFYQHSEATERWRQTGHLGQDCGQAEGEVVRQQKACVTRAKGP